VRVTMTAVSLDSKYIAVDTDRILVDTKTVRRLTQNTKFLNME